MSTLSEQQAQLYMMKGMMADIPADHRERILKAKDAIKAIAKSEGEYAPVVMAVAQLEFAIEAEKGGVA